MQPWDVSLDYDNNKYIRFFTDWNDKRHILSPKYSRGMSVRYVFMSEMITKENIFPSKMLSKLTRKWKMYSANVLS